MITRLAQTISFRVGSLPRSSTLNQTISFRVGTLPGRPGLIDQDISFEVRPVEPSVFVLDHGDWHPSAQRAWADGRWFPSV